MIGPARDTLANLVEAKFVHIYSFQLIANGGFQVSLDFPWRIEIAANVVNPLRIYKNPNGIMTILARFILAPEAIS